MLRFLKVGTTIRPGDRIAATGRHVPSSLHYTKVQQEGVIQRVMADSLGRPAAWGEGCKKVTIRIPVSLLSRIPGTPSTTAAQWVVERISGESNRNRALMLLENTKNLTSGDARKQISEALTLLREGAR